MSDVSSEIFHCLQPDSSDQVINWETASELQTEGPSVCLQCVQFTEREAPNGK